MAIPQQDGWSLSISSRQESPAPSRLRPPASRLPMVECGVREDPRLMRREMFTTPPETVSTAQTTHRECGENLYWYGHLESCAYAEPILLGTTASWITR